MKYNLVKDLINLVEEFELSKINTFSKDIEGFKKWICSEKKKAKPNAEEPYWEGKEKGRSAESIINTLIVHLNRYAKTYSKAAIHDSDFSTQEEFIYLINLKALGAMTKMELIKKNIQEKSAGIQIINRLLQQGWVEQHDSALDKRSKIIGISEKGIIALEKQMDKIRLATKVVTGNLTETEKVELIRLLSKLEDFHQPIFAENLASSELLDKVVTQYLP
ncbi:MarR family winged helix-turn-helix transcriptional regulator [Flavobacterium agrisoli]|uniref:MarR family transcriptional regulator n=1 Tax=Flavobacterium agrisoli TaxID=2793066 RepID=A0A934PNK3_9FLAO|nr:helix-turn-helix domain-containing protein [Flavobacterium agrisoli]MBK0370160.1 MarR family transcriptional regulator [Flavobacterium agrisoli]